MPPEDRRGETMSSRAIQLVFALLKIRKANPVTVGVEDLGSLPATPLLPEGIFDKESLLF